MTYQTKCNGHCTEQIDTQAETIHKLREESRKKTEALIEASKQIAQLRAEKSDLTDVLNKVSERNKVLEKELDYWRNRESGEVWF